ncbi:LuxR C-terminal-related transcriptional regulator [Chitinophaga horti]|uniref:LuxR C-terminal-related transcriptional regulator n=1 Tax=Chitinophaga horti TaxID=2920382 RepID=A0ABY6IYJ6_9BACT|nr:LuxR C-terminal-related transcriptional regulator [Chitinophaga horti]UYQ92457.1 LuxR C-terminal-related transcriptional regulator [Chitinophaga horti]
MQDQGTGHRDSPDAMISENARSGSQLQQLQSIVQQMPAMVYISNIDQQSVTWCNKTLEDTIGYSLEEMQSLGSAFFPLVIHPDDRMVTAESSQSFREKKNMFGGVLRVKRRDSDYWFWVVGLGCPYTFDEQGNVVDVICAFLDISIAIDTGSQISEALREVLRRRNEDILNKLTAREKVIFTLAAQGFNNKEIAEKLTLSRYTVETHRKNIRLKLKVRNTSELVALAKQTGIQ